MNLPIPIFRNEINALGDFKGGVKVARDFAVPGYEPQTSWNMLLAPAHTPSPIIDKLSGAIRTALRDPEVANIIQRDGFIPDDRDPAATAAFLKQQLQQMSEAVKAAGIELN